MTQADTRATLADGALLDEEGPAAWLFDPVSERIVAANKTALVFFGEPSLYALVERSFAPSSPFLAFAAEVLAAGAPQLKRIPIAESRLGAVEAVRLEPIRLPGGAPGLKATLHPWRTQSVDPDTQRLAEALRLLPRPILLARGDGRILFANEAAGKFLSAAEGDLATALGYDTATALAEGLAAHGHVSRAFDIALKGATRRIHIDARRQRDPVIGVPLDSILLRDITGMAALEQVLAAERKSLRNLLTLAADFTFECDALGIVTALSPGFREATGLAPEMAIGRRIGAPGALLAIEDDAASLFAAAPDRFDELAVTVATPGGTPVPLKLSAHARKAADGSFLGYAGVGWRHTESQPAAPKAPSTAPLVRSLAAIVNAAQDTLLVLGNEGRVRFANAAAETLFGGPRVAIEGKRLTDLIVPGARPALAQTMERLLSEGAESRILTLRGAEKPVRLILRRIDRGNPPMLCATFSDLSPFKAAEAELRHARDAAETANKQKSEFLAKVSHELRTPLNAIIGFAEIMREEQLGPIGNPRYAGYIRDIHHSAHLLLSLINDLIDLSKVESGRFTLKFEPVDIGRVVTQVVHLMEPAAKSAGILVAEQIAFALPAVVADERSVEQIVLNLLSNAIKFTKRGGRVVVSALPTAEGGVTIAVRDTGIGMSPADLKVALEPFRRVNRSEVLEQPGTGLGLPLAKSLAEANHAQFRIESEPRAGTSIEIAFPRGRLADEKIAHFVAP
jgi:PAS domain S-box-containing protein